MREAALAVAAIAAAYANTFAGGFQFDDWNVVVADPRVQSLGAWWGSMPGIRPLLKLSFALNHRSGLGLAGFHAVNVALHAANALLVLALFRRLEARAAPPGAPTAQPGRASLAAALVFALHPAQTEAVTYVSGRSASLAATLVLASALVHVAGRDGWRPRLARVLSPALLACALGVKELAVALPVVLTAVELADPRASRRDAGRGAGCLAAALRSTAGHWLVVLVALALFAASPTYGKLAAASLARRGAWSNVLTHLHGVAWLAGQALRPDLLDADPVVPVATRLDAVAAATAVVLVALLALGSALLMASPKWIQPVHEPESEPEPEGSRARARSQGTTQPGAAPGRPPTLSSRCGAVGGPPSGDRRLVGLAILWTVLWLPAAGLLLPRPEAANDRQLYLSLAGAGWLAGRALGALQAVAPRSSRTGWRNASALLAAALLMLLGAGTFVRNRVYADEVTFWEAALARSPANARALNNLGFALAARCRTDEAAAAFARAADLEPGDPTARVNLRLLRDGEPLGAGERACPRPR